MKVSKRIILVLITSMLLLLPLTYVETPKAENSCLTNTSFHMYGQTTCPYCQMLKNFFVEKYSEHYSFCFIDQDADCYKKFENLIDKMVNEWGVTKAGIGIGVPITLVMKDTNNTIGIYFIDSKVVTAIVIGAVTNETFWLQLSCKEPSDELYIYTGQRLALLVKSNHETPSTQQNSIFIGIPIVILIIAISIGGYILLSRKK